MQPDTEQLDRKETLAIRRKHHGYNVALSYDSPIHMVSAVGCEMTDDEGHVWLDCVNNVAHVGHCESSVVAAQCQQLATLNTNSRYLSHVHAQYTKALADEFPDPLQVTFLTCSGSEANDLALQICTAAVPGATDVAVMEGAYHGHTMGMMSCSPYKFWGRSGSGRPEHVHVLPLPDTYRGVHLDGKVAAQAVIRAASKRSAKIAAFYCESLLSCGGQVILPPGYLKAVYEEMHAHGAICIADEVQCGFGRLGSVMWGFQTQDVEPDIVVLGKAMGNGFPMAGLVTTPALATAFDNGYSYFNTTGGNNTACATGLAVLKAVHTLEFMKHGAEVGAYLLSRLKLLQQGWGDIIGDVRGMGMFIGIEVVRDSDSKAPYPGAAKWLKERLKARFVLISTDGPMENVLKVKPPMPFSKRDADHLVACMQGVLDEEWVASQECILELDREIMSSIEPGQVAARQYFHQLMDATSNQA